ncbi:hypothetical protein EC988_003495 [Linderina pennispora]|nr:hypothetical protein EC988_003495 [Linderina pennispora]
MDGTPYMFRQCRAASTLCAIADNAEALSQALDSPEPSVVALPNIMYVDEPTVISQSTSTSHARPEEIEAITRPGEQKVIAELLDRYLDIQTRSPILGVRPGVIRRSLSQHMAMARGLFIRGCKGIGKSFLMLLTAVHLLARMANSRVVYIGDCGSWQQCSDRIQRCRFIAEAFANAFANDDEVLDIIDRWWEKRNHEGQTFSANKLFSDIKRYCREHNLVVAVFVDRINAASGPGDAQSDVIAYLKYLKMTCQFAIVLAASDDNVAESISQELAATTLPIRQPFSSTEASLYIINRCPQMRTRAVHLKDMLNATWRHPSELFRLCRYLTLADGNEDYDHLVTTHLLQFSVAPFTGFAPRPFGNLANLAAVGYVARSIVDVLQMRPPHWMLADTNYMVLIHARDMCLYLFSCPSVARGMVGLHCPDEIPSDTLSVYLENMRCVKYQLPVQTTN